MKARESRKQLLIAESELNRGRLLEDWRTMAGKVHTLNHQAKIIGSVAAGAALLLSGFSALRRKQSAPALEKSSWWQVLLKGAEMAGSIWPELRSRGRPKNTDWRSS